MGQWGVLNTGLPIGASLGDITLITARIDNLEDGLDGTDYLSDIDINGAAIDGTPIGATTASTGAFTTLSATGSAIFNSNVTINSTLTIYGSVVFNSIVTGSVTFGSSITLSGGIATGGNESLRFDRISSSTGPVTTGTLVTYIHNYGGTLLGAIPGAVANNAIDVTGFKVTTSAVVLVCSADGGGPQTGDFSLVLVY